MSNKNQLKVSVIIPVIYDGNYQESLASVKRQNFPADKLEILIAEGRHRSIQRNAAIQKVRGEFIWFMDNDVTIHDPEYLNKALAYFEDGKVASVGGPSLTHPTDSFFQRTVGLLLGSYFATQSIRSRYTPLGQARVASEKELILCSQLFRTAAVGDGFDPRLHSGNEENHLMNRIAADGYSMIYDPELPVYRSQRRNLKEFILQMGKYGKSRMEHFMISPSVLEVAFLVPSFFFGYIISLFALPWLKVPLLLKQLYLAPLALYGALALFGALEIAWRGRNVLYALLAFPLFGVLHLSYALGSFFAIFRYFRPEMREIPPVRVTALKL